ncbi:uncharacterized protein LOC133030467 [Cannabis sativa]|uniref:uncharacterized protein LOC133030467 n=1 Tax=Cannabis sativa TaxID=3483 RepID=UPI0029C9BFCF|nr:uncharacterized protein LOC133030467 [Cannabis sativa]
MAKKKRAVRKPASTPLESTSIASEHSPVGEEEPVEEIYHEPCADLGYEEEIAPTTEKSIGSIPRNWAEEVEKADFQATAADLWSKFPTDQVLTPSTRLEYTEPIKVGDQIVAKIDIEEAEIEASYWKNAIVCIVLGANPPFKVFEGFVNRVWGKLGIEKVARMNSGFTLVKFRDEATRDLILETGVIHFDKKPVVLRPWTTDMDAARMIKSVPVWIRLNGLGLQYWGKTNLSALVSTIGTPIMVDKVTMERSMVKFARVLVDMVISDNPPKTISFINERKQLVEQSVEYEWLPTKCTACDLLGHTVANCNKENKVTWKKKTSTAANKEPDEPIGGVSQPIVNETVRTDRTMATIENEQVEKGQKQGSMQGIGAVNSEWMTPKRKGMKIANVVETRAIENFKNGYEVLQETIDGNSDPPISITFNGGV